MIRSRYWVGTYKFTFFSNLVEKNSLIVKKIPKFRENAIERLRNGKLPTTCPLVCANLNA